MKSKEIEERFKELIIDKIELVSIKYRYDTTRQQIDYYFYDTNNNLICDYNTFFDKIWVSYRHFWDIVRTYGFNIKTLTKIVLRPIIKQYISEINYNI